MQLKTCTPFSNKTWKNKFHRLDRFHEKSAVERSIIQGLVKKENQRKPINNGMSLIKLRDDKIFQKVIPPFCKKHASPPMRLEFLFRVLLGIGALFQVGVTYNA